MARNVRQYVAITGFDSESFAKTLAGLARVRRLFEDSLPINKLDSLQLVSMDGIPALSCHTRYFTTRRDCSSTILQNFGPHVDPNGDLEKLKGEDFVHTEDNIVQYLGKKEENEETSCVIHISHYIV